MRISEYRQQHNWLSQGPIPGWHWRKGDGTYDRGYGFFLVHWEIRHDDPLSVRFHVESPNWQRDQALSDIKARMIAAVLSSDIPKLAAHHEMVYRVGSRTSSAEICRNKGTEAFRIILPLSRQPDGYEANIRHVHSLLGAAIRRVIAPYREELAAHLPEFQ